MKLLIPLLFPIFLKLRRLNRRKNKITSPAFKGFNDFLSMSLCGIFYIIILINTKSKKDENKKNEKETEKENGNENINSKNQKERKNAITMKLQIEMKNLEMENLQKKRKLYFIIAISGLQLIAVIIKNLFKDDIEEGLKLNLSVLMEIILFIYFSIKFLGLIIYSHQIFSMIGIFIFLIIFFIESVIYNEIKFKKIVLSIIYYFSVQFFYGLSDVLGKKYLNSFIENIYSFIFKVGIFGLIPICIYGLIVEFIDIDNKYKIYLQFSKISIQIYALDLFFSCLFEIGLWLTIYYFTPCHYIIFETIADFLEIILSKFEEDNSQYSSYQQISFFIIYPIIILIVLVFNEIIILNFCNLDFNTKVRIMEREKVDAFNNEMNDIKLIPDDEIEDEKGEGGYLIN